MKKPLTNSLWIEKYRSENLDGYICDETLKSKLQHYIETNDIPHILLFGLPGCGKTTLAKLLVNNLNCDYLYINAADKKGIDTVRDEVIPFVSSASFKPLKVVILDEASFLMKSSAQPALLNTIEQFSANTRFILTCNYLEQIIEPLQSRCDMYHIEPPSKGVVAKHILGILQKENITFDKNDLVTIINQKYPDIRSIIKVCQSCSLTGTLVIDESLLADTHAYESIMDLLIKPKKDSWYQIRQIVEDNEIREFTPLYRYIFDNIELLKAGCEGEITIIADEYLWKSNTVADKVINFMAAIAQILQIVR